MKSRYHVTMGAVAGALLLPTVLMADSISPSSVTASLSVGGSTTVEKLVTVNAGTPTTSKVDVYFLADTTGSMGSVINSVKASASLILANTAGLGDVAFGVGEYKDWGDAYAFRQNLASPYLTTVQATAQAGINAWGASGGGDWAEAQLYALKQVADTTGWRAGSTRILVWFGDAPGHDPSAGVTEAAATAALQAKSIKTEAIDVGSMDYYGQASRIAAATGGAYYSGISSGSIVAAIQAAITSSFTTYSSVGLDLSEVPAGVTVTATPGSYNGSYDRSVDRTFSFQVTFTGNTPGTYDFNIYGTVDGGHVATEADHITVNGIPGIPDGGSSLVLLSLAAVGLLGVRRMQS